MNRSRFLEDAKRYDDSSCLIAFKMIDAATTTPIELNTLEKEVLVHMITELGTRYQIADAERLQLKRLMNDVKSIRIQFAELFIRHEELQSAHLMQSKVIQKLQKNQRKVDVYSETIKTQENIILKLETIIKFQSSAGTPNTDESKFIDMNTSDTLVMTSEVKKLIDQINKLELEISSLKNMQKKSIDNICNNDGEIIDSNTSNRFQLYEIELLKLEESATHNQRVLSQLHSENYRLKESVTEMEAALQKALVLNKDIPEKCMKYETELQSRDEKISNLDKLVDQTGLRYLIEISNLKRRILELEIELESKHNHNIILVKDSASDKSLYGGIENDVTRNIADVNDTVGCNVVGELSVLNSNNLVVRQLSSSLSASSLVTTVLNSSNKTSSVSTTPPISVLNNTSTTLRGNGFAAVSVLRNSNKSEVVG